MALLAVEMAETVGWLPPVTYMLRPLGASAIPKELMLDTGMAGPTTVLVAVSMTYTPGPMGLSSRD